ncbi:hypothetical protein EMPG_14700, partial [Blastomyces silverae]
MTPNMNLRLLRRLIRRTNPRKLLDYPFPRLLIQPLRIPLLRHLNGDIDIDLYKRQTGRRPRARFLA